MPLTCACPYDDDFEWYYHRPDDYSVMPFRTRRTRCSSCGSLIGMGDTVLEFERTRYPRDDIEERIYGYEPDAVYLSSYYLCEKCADLWWSFYELGYECVAPDENMQELVKDYAEQAKAEREETSRAAAHPVPGEAGGCASWQLMS